MELTTQNTMRKLIAALYLALALPLAAYPPAALTVTQDTAASRLRLQWTDTATNETAWEVQVYFTRTKTHTWLPWNTLDPLPPNTTATAVEYSLKGYYSFRVRPLGEGSPWSNVVTVRVR